MNIGYRHRLDEEIEAWAHGNRLLFFRLYGNFQSMAELRCAPTEYGFLAILGAVSDRCPMRAAPLGKSQITPMQTEAFLSKNRGASDETKK